MNNVMLIFSIIFMVLHIVFLGIYGYYFTIKEEIANSVSSKKAITSAEMSDRYDEYLSQKVFSSMAILNLTFKINSVVFLARTTLLISLVTFLFSYK